MTPEQREAMLSPAAAWFERDMPIGGTDAEAAAALFDMLAAAGFSISLASVRDHTNCEMCDGVGMVCDSSLIRKPNPCQNEGCVMNQRPCPGGSPVVWAAASPDPESETP